MCGLTRREGQEESLWRLGRRRRGVVDASPALRWVSRPAPSLSQVAPRKQRLDENGHGIAEVGGARGNRTGLVRSTREGSLRRHRVNRKRVVPTSARSRSIGRPSTTSSAVKASRSCSFMAHLEIYRRFREQVEAFATRFRVIVYSWRFFPPNASPRATDVSPLAIHVADLRTLIADLEAGPAHLVCALRTRAHRYDGSGPSPQDGHCPPTLVHKLFERPACEIHTGGIEVLNGTCSIRSSQLIPKPSPRTPRSA